MSKSLLYSLPSFSSSSSLIPASSNWTQGPDLWLNVMLPDLWVHGSKSFERAYGKGASGVIQSGRKSHWLEWEPSSSKLGLSMVAALEEATPWTTLEETM